MSEKKSAKLKRQSSKRKDGLEDNVDGDDDDDNNDDANKPLRIGDFITLRNIPTGKATKRGFLGAEGVLDDNCVVAEQPMRFDDSGSRARCRSRSTRRRASRRARR